LVQQQLATPKIKDIAKICLVPPAQGGSVQAYRSMVRSDGRESNIRPLVLAIRHVSGYHNDFEPMLADVENSLMAAFRILLAFPLLLSFAAALHAEDEEHERDLQLLREAKIKPDGPSQLEYFRKRSLSEEQRQELLSLIGRLGNDSFLERQKASAQLETYGLKAITLLKQGQGNLNPEIAVRCARCLQKLEAVPSNVLTAAVSRMLGRLKPAGALETMLAQLPLAEDEYVADAMRWSISQLATRDGQPQPVLVDALSDKLAVRRAAAAEALVRTKAIEVLPKVHMLLKDEDPEVRLRTAVILITVAKEKVVVQELIALLAKLPPAQASQAEDLLHSIAGDDGPKVTLLGDDAARIRCRDAWADWWSQNADRVDLAKLDDGQRFLGYLVLVEMNQNTGVGKAMEFAADNKTIRWQIDGLQFPIDVQVLPQNQHVLIAEHNANQVTERDFQGKILWKKEIIQPLSCQRLANGNTFIASRNQLIETDQKDTNVFTFNRFNGDMVAASRTKDGQYAFVTQQGQYVRIDRDGKELKSFSLGTRMNFYSCLQLLPGNRFLVTHLANVAEYDEGTGKQVWNAAVGRNPTTVQRLPNGNTLASSTVTRKIVELDRNGKTIWELYPPDNGVPWRVKRR
jgi:HEAT repeat protein